jgi:hypothetical protein
MNWARARNEHFSGPQPRQPQQRQRQRGSPPQSPAATAARPAATAGLATATASRPRTCYAARAAAPPPPRQAASGDKDVPPAEGSPPTPPAVAPAWQPRSSTPGRVAATQVRARKPSAEAMLGFGRHATLTRRQVWEGEKAYVSWARKAIRQGPVDRDGDPLPDAYWKKLAAFGSCCDALDEQAARDPDQPVGFGDHRLLSRRQLRRQQPDYVEWCRGKVRGGETHSSAMVALVNCCDTMDTAAAGGMQRLQATASPEPDRSMSARHKRAHAAASNATSTNPAVRRRLDMSSAAPVGTPPPSTSAQSDVLIADQPVGFGKYRALSRREVRRKDPGYVDWCRDKVKRGAGNAAMVSLVSCCDDLNASAPPNAPAATTTAVIRAPARHSRSNPDPATFVCSRHRCGGFKGPLVSRNGEAHNNGRKFFVCPHKGHGSADCSLQGGFRWEDGSRPFSASSCRRAEQFHGLPAGSVVPSAAAFLQR